MLRKYTTTTTIYNTIDTHDEPVTLTREEGSDRQHTIPHFSEVVEAPISVTGMATGTPPDHEAPHSPVRGGGGGLSSLAHDPRESPWTSRHGRSTPSPCWLTASLARLEGVHPSPCRVVVCRRRSALNSYFAIAFRSPFASEREVVEESWTTLEQMNDATNGLVVMNAALP